MALLAVSGGIYAAGIALMLDDYKDIGLASTPDHPSPFHHWMWGFILFLIGLATICLSLFMLLKKMVQQKRLMAWRHPHS